MIQIPKIQTPQKQLSPQSFMKGKGKKNNIRFTIVDMKLTQQVIVNARKNFIFFKIIFMTNVSIKTTIIKSSKAIIGNVSVIGIEYTLNKREVIKPQKGKPALAKAKLLKNIKNKNKDIFFIKSPYKMNIKQLYQKTPCSFF